MKQFVILSLMVLVVSLFSGCNADKEQLSEKAAIEGKAQSKASIEAENSNLVTKSSAMENDLAVRHRFYQAVKGSYEGSLTTEQGEFRVKITLVPSLPPYTSGRIRQLDEISSDLNNLYLNAQVVQWNPLNKLSAVGCRIEHVRPDIVNGEINIASENCPNLYALRIAAQGEQPTTYDSRVASDYAARIREGRIDRVSSILGEVHPSTNASVYPLIVSRMER